MELFIFKYVGVLHICFRSNLNWIHSYTYSQEPRIKIYLNQDFQNVSLWTTGLLKVNDYNINSPKKAVETTHTQPPAHILYCKIWETSDT